MAYTVDQCRKVVKMHEKIEFFSGLLGPSCPIEVEKLLKKTNKMLEKEIEKLLFKKI